MKQFITLLLIGGLLVAFSSNVEAQKLKLKKGSFTGLKGQKTVKIEFEYNTAVGKFKKESDYIKKKTKEYNEKEAGRGDTWAKAWVADRQARFEPKFKELFNEYSKDYFELTQGSDETEYTLIFRTTFTEPGFNIGIMKKDALISGELVLVKTDNPDKILATLTVENSPGRTFAGFDYDTGTRLQESYAKAGKECAKYLVKKQLKK